MNAGVMNTAAHSADYQVYKLQFMCPTRCFRWSSNICAILFPFERLDCNMYGTPITTEEPSNATNITMKKFTEGSGSFTVWL